MKDIPNPRSPKTRPKIKAFNKIDKIDEWENRPAKKDKINPQAAKTPINFVPCIFPPKYKYPLILYTTM
jgi:hypothetical protein